MLAPPAAGDADVERLVHGRDHQNRPAAQRIGPDLEVNFQIRPDTLGRGSILVISTVYQPFNVGVSGSRRREHLVPGDHPGATLTKKILAKIEEAALALDRKS